MKLTTENKKIGVVTFFKGNYGSILQCYATCEILKKLGYSPYVIDKIDNRLSNIFRFALRCAFHPRHVKTFIEIRNKAFSGGSRIDIEDKREMDEFVNDVLPVVSLNYSDLKKLGNDKNYLAFLSGSDQIWGGHEYVVDPVRFLRFAPKNKRIAWAPSFGTTDIAKYNIKMYKHYISQYSALSVREPSGEDLVKQLTSKQPHILIDPVYLLTRDEWLSFAENKNEDKYVFCYFLDALSDTTIQQINSYCEKYHVKALAFGPWNESYNNMNIEHLHGGPTEFVSHIANAQCVFTDSFHALSFSLILNTNFFVYRRNYAHGIEQSSRIKSILLKTNMLKHFEPDTVDNIEWDFSNSNAVISKERISMIKYLTDSIKNSCKGEFVEKDKQIQLKDANSCVGCGACIAICPHSAITKNVSTYTWTPIINEELCVKCGLCQSVCDITPTKHSDKKQAYIAYSSNSQMRINSASGGVFSAFATFILEKGGIVYGASLKFDEGKAIVEHLRITNSKDLPMIMGSKYVQSDTGEAYQSVKDDLINGKTVLFSGCSCQIAGLKSYLKNIDQSNLYTIDLVCHGVPTIDFFNKYINWLEKKYNSNISKLSFRSKREGKIVYEITLDFENSKTVVIPIRDSGYYRMFIDEESYRNSCYNCEYASLDKPADITTGDYFEAAEDYPNLFTGDNAINRDDGISCMIVHTQKGRDLLEKASSQFVLYEVDSRVVQASHGNLNRPSKYSKIRAVLKYISEIFGYGAIEDFYKFRNTIVDIIKKR